MFPWSSTLAQSLEIHQVTKLLAELKDEDTGGSSTGACGSWEMPKPFPATMKGQALRDLAGSAAGSRKGRVARLSGS
jgi:hypothetical protein